MVEEKFNLEFTFVELNLLLKALEELPFKHVVGVRTSIVNQYEVIQKEKELVNKKVTKKTKEVVEK